jgi:hypothetical protein
MYKSLTKVVFASISAVKAKLSRGNSMANVLGFWIGAYHDVLCPRDPRDDGRNDDKNS